MNMAVAYTLEGGDLAPQVVWKCVKNIAGLLSDEGGILTDPANYPLNLTVGLNTFRLRMNAIFAQFNTDLTVAGLVTLEGGDSWLDLRAKLNTNFGLVDAVVNP